jgi:hypothetical protein
VPKAEVLALFATAPAIDTDELRADLDDSVSQEMHDPYQETGRCRSTPPTQTTSAAQKPSPKSSEYPPHDEHRLVCIVTEAEIILLAARYHY